MRKLILILALLAVLFAVAQFVRPSMANPPVTLDVQVPDSVKAVFRKGCYDCHSNETGLKWFDKITPANFLVAGHIRDGRKALNFSNWDSLDAGARIAKLFWGVNDIRNKEMPLGSYLSLHGSARINDQELSVLENYLSAITLPTTGLHPAPAVYRETDSVKPEWNGIHFISGFQNWQLVSITERFDNASLRVIYGNDIAAKAVNDGKTNPWPDGTVLAKAAWKEQVDSSGNISRGSFWQVELMIKDSKRYAATLGWGFGRWRGTDLKPYGSDESFTGECVRCHRPLKSSDYTFTYPLKHTEGSAPQSILVGESVNTSDRSMSVTYADGSIATWSQRADPKWFGARIPDSLLSIQLAKQATKALTP